MADVKISALPPATGVGGSDILPVVVGGVTERVTKAIFLTGLTGEDIALTAAVGQTVGIFGNAGQSAFVVTDDQFLTATATTWITLNVIGATINNEILIEASSGITITVDAGKQLVFKNSGGGTVFRFDDATSTILLAAGGVTPNIYYPPSTPGNWLGTAPFEVLDALNRLAACFTANGLIKP